MKKSVLIITLSLILIFAITSPSSAAILEWNCGDKGSNVQVSIDTTSRLMMVSGEGAMATFESFPPWYDYRNYADCLVIAEGVTRVDSLYSLQSLTKMYIPKSLVTCGPGSFAYSGISYMGGREDGIYELPVYYAGNENEFWKINDEAERGKGLFFGTYAHFFYNVPYPGTNFKDVSPDDYYGSAVKWAVDKDITAGIDVTHFGPELTCTRGQMVTFLWRSAGSPAPQTTNNPFHDVNISEYYGKAVLWAVENKITAGTSATTFSPNAEVTRGQCVTFLHRLAGCPIVSNSVPFIDVTPNDFFHDAVLWAAKNKVTAGTSTNTFSPYNACTRGQIVTFLYRYYE